MTGLVIAIDGPAAAGKGTLARRLAAHFGLPYLDTGLLYRAVARLVLDAGGDPADAAAAETAARALHPADLERGDLRGPPVDGASSRLAAFPGVRAALLQFQRDFPNGRGAVLDGRDIGTVVFPNAPVKLFVTADPAERARRRFEELRARGAPADPETVTNDMRRRDAADSGRDAAPTLAASDAIPLDTTALDAEAAFTQALALIEQKLAQSDQTN